MIAVDFTAIDFERALGRPLSGFAQQCHAASLAIVKARVLPSARVARGTCRGVFGQHSWVVLGGDCYDDDAMVVDPTLWSYDDTVEGVWIGQASERPHRPHGKGDIWTWGRPAHPTGEIVELPEPEGGWSSEARLFLDILGPLDETGWRQLAHAPVGGWPSGEIFAAMYTSGDRRLAQWFPIDIIGMTTDLNPSGLYLAE